MPHIQRKYFECARATHRVAALALFAIAGALSGCGRSSNGDGTDRVNGSIHVAAGMPASPVATVDGSIVADDNAVLQSARTVNGGISIGAHARAESLATVNGPITLKAGARISGAITVVNGSITLADGAEVSGTLTNVSGKIALNSAHVAGGIVTVNADISVLGSSRVEGGITVKNPSGLFFHASDATPQIVIGPGAVVQGNLRFLHKVALYVSDHATIGPVSGATAIPFAGPTPPVPAPT